MTINYSGLPIKDVVKSLVERLEYVEKCIETIENEDESFKDALQTQIKESLLHAVAEVVANKVAPLIQRIGHLEQYTTELEILINAQSINIEEVQEDSPSIEELIDGEIANVNNFSNYPNINEIWKVKAFPHTPVRISGILIDDDTTWCYYKWGTNWNFESHSTLAEFLQDYGLTNDDPVVGELWTSKTANISVVYEIHDIDGSTVWYKYPGNNTNINGAMPLSNFKNLFKKYGT